MIVELLTSFMMTYKMPELSYAPNALEPVISEETVNYHYGKHLQTYVNNLNKLVEDTEFAGKPVEYVVAHAADGPIYNNAGQVLNHTLYFTQFAPLTEAEKQAYHRAAQSQGEQAVLRRPAGRILKAIDESFGSFDSFQKLMNATAVSLFGSGWVWLAADEAGKLHIVQEVNGGNPLRRKMTPLLGFDVWEHAYYLDFQNRRAEHLAALWYIIDWKVVEERLLQAGKK